MSNASFFPKETYFPSEIPEPEKSNRQTEKLSETNFVIGRPSNLFPE